MTNDIAARLADDGYAVVRDVLEPRDLDPLEPEFAHLLETRATSWHSSRRLAIAAPPHIDNIRRGLLELAALPDFDEALLAELDITLPHAPFAVVRSDSPFHVGPCLLGLVSSPRLLSVVEMLVGSNITLSPNCHARYKLPTSATTGITPWHRDGMTHHADSDPVPVITTWVPMDDVNENNGCLVVAPGGHRTHPSLNWPLTADVVKELDALGQPLPARKGDIVLLDKNLPHSSLPNRSSAVRWSFDLRYYPSSGPSDRPWFPSLEVLARGRTPHPAPDAADWQRRWERTRDMFASTGQVVPGRPDYARAVAEQHIDRWGHGRFPQPA